MTGVQIYRRLPLVHLTQPQREEVWKTAVTLSRKAPVVRNDLLGLIGHYIACDQGLESSAWLACSSTDAVFFRVIRIGNDPAIDLVIDTTTGAGRMVKNLVKCLLPLGWLPWRPKCHLASFLVERNSEPRNVPGSLVMDFGTTATSFIFAPQGEPPLKAQPLELPNPFDPADANTMLRPAVERRLFRSTAVLLHIDEHPASKPWLLMGKAAEETIPNIDPFVSSLWAPKKYIRDWPEHLKAEEPTTTGRGIVGQRPGLGSTLQFVQLVLEQLLTLAVSAQVNPRFSSGRPQCYPQIKEVLLTYPLIWREQERALFQRMIRTAAEELFVLPDAVREQFQVHLLCSEPVAVAAHVIWEVFFQFLHLAPGGKNLLKPSLVSSMMGNIEGDQELRLLVVDIGGGSTDIALVEARWTVGQAVETRTEEPQLSIASGSFLAPETEEPRRNDPSGSFLSPPTRPAAAEPRSDRADAGKESPAVDLHLQVLESLRFNRAGDRLSHLLATAILEFMRRKHGIKEVLDIDAPAANPAFTRQRKRAVISQISKLVEQAKAHLVAHPDKPWVLRPHEERELLIDLELARVETVRAVAVADERLEISLDRLRRWVEMDRQSEASQGEPGLMDVFFDLEDLGQSLKARGQFPHLVLLSGRTTRLPFIKALVMKHLNLPAHRVRTMGELLPPGLRSRDHDNIDKLAVVYGAHRFKFGYPIRFIAVPQEAVFRRHIGTVEQTLLGMRLNQVLVRAGTAQPQTCTLRLSPGATVLIGHAFCDGRRAEVIATVENTTDAWRDVEIDLVNDYRVELNRAHQADGVRVTEHVPGGTNAILDNFNDTGKIDREPDGLLRSIVLSNADPTPPRGAL
jgi:hypothetical protein